MTIKTKIITITICGVLVVIAAYISRDGWAVGSEWMLAGVVAGVIVEIVPEREKGEEHERDSETGSHTGYRKEPA